MTAQVEIAAGPFRVVSLMNRQPADELGLEPGTVVSATETHAYPACGGFTLALTPATRF